MAIPAVPAVPNPLSTTFAADALTFTQWMHTAAPEFNTAVNDANAAVGDAVQAGLDAAAQVGLATTQAGNASSSASTASGHAIAADNARAAAVLAKDAAEDARDMSQTYAGLAGAAAGLPAFAGQALKALRVNGAENGVEWTDQFPVASITRTLKTGAYTLVGADKGAIIDCAGTWTLGADASIAAGWWAYVRNAGAGDITIDPAGATTVGGAATHVLKPGFTILLVRDATGFTVMTVKRRTYDRLELITSNTSWVVPADMFVLRAYAVGKGGDGSTTASGGGAGMAFGDIAVTPGATVSISFAAGVAKVTVGGVDLLTANPASGVTAGTASTHASVTNGGAYSGGAGTSANARGGASSGSPLGAGVAAGAGTGGAGWGGAGNSSSSGGGGGVGGAAVNPGGGGPGLRMEDMMTEPLLSRLTSPGVINRATTSSGVDGGPGAGGAPNSSTGTPTGNGGFGAGGAATAATAGLKGGLGGFGGGGGGGSSSATPGDGGNGGHGGGGGSPGTSGAAGGVGGPAAVLLMY